VFFQPNLVVTPLGGVVADRYDRARVLAATQSVSVVQAAVLFLLVTGGHPSLVAVVLLAFLLGVTLALELPVRQVYLTELVPPVDVPSAVALHSSAFNITRFIGPGLCALAIGAAGVSVTFALAAALSLVALGSIVMSERARGGVSTRRSVHSGGVLAGLRDAVRYARGDSRIRLAMVLAAAGSVFGIMTFQTLAPIYVLDHLGLGGPEYGTFMALWGAGAVIGALTVTAIARDDRRRWLVVGTAGLAILLTGLAATTSTHVAFAMAGLLGFFQILLAQNALIAVQMAAPDHLRGGIIGLYWVVFQGASPVGAFLAGGLADRVGVQGAMLGGALALGATLAVVLTRLDRVDVPASAAGGTQP
jgi:predicted MFS family arabinose efflux permease